MDTSAHRTLKTARDQLTELLTFTGQLQHRLSEEQVDDLMAVTRQLWRLMNDDPSPPECQNCATGLTQGPTGRPRRFCSDACRSADARARASFEANQ